MNCPSRTEEPEGTGYNQNPNALAADLTTRQDLNGRANSRVLRRMASSIDVGDAVEDETGDLGAGNGREEDDEVGVVLESVVRRPSGLSEVGRPREDLVVSEGIDGGGRSVHGFKGHSRSVWQVVKKFGKFVGPGFMVCVPLQVHHRTAASNTTFFPL